MGDVGVIRTSYGYHVMYFEKTHSAPMWKITIAGNLIGDSYTKIIDDSIASGKYDYFSSGTLDNINKVLYSQTVKAYYSEIN